MAGNPMFDPQRFKNLTAAEKVALRNRLAEACARVGLPQGDSETPGDLALRLDGRVVQRDHLAQIDQAFRDIHLGHLDRVIVTCPPQVGKTHRVVWAIFWWLTYHPHARVILASYGAQLAATRGRMVRQLVRDHGAPYGLRLDPEQSAISDWALTAGGGMRTAGMGSGVTGNPADLIVIDDPHKNRAEADSPQIRDKVWDTYSSSLLSRGSPGMPIIMVLTRWHPDDLAARVLAEEGAESAGGRWRLIHLPAIATVDGDAIGRSIGEPLPHPKIAPGDTAAAAAHWADKRRTSTIRDWAALYQGDPAPAEGALATPELMERQRDYSGSAEPRIVAVAVDPSGGGRDDAGVIGGHLADDGRAYWTHDKSGVMGSDEWSRAACQLAHDIEADRFVVERNYGGDMARLVLRTAWDALAREAADANLADRIVGATPLDPKPWGPCPRIVEVSAKRGKLLRAEPIAQQLAEDRMRTGNPLPEVESVWTTWQPGTQWSPGALDASVYLAYELLPVPGSESVISTAKDVKKGDAGAVRSVLAKRKIR